MKWYELKVSTSSQASEVIASILMEAGSTGVAIEDPADLLSLDERFGELKPYKEELYESDEVFVSGYFPDTKNIVEIRQEIESKLEEAKTYGLDLGKNQLVQSSVAEEDWANAWKAYYHPVRISRYLTIVPSWESYEPGPGETVLLLDPGMAFGTGTHPTTRLSLQALEMVLRGGEHVLDVGTGSGILSIAAKALGASQVEAYDLDEKATSVARENISLNPFAQDIQVYENDLLVGLAKSVDIIVANILAEILERLVKDAWQNLKAGGYFILAGIIQSKRNGLVQKLEEAGFLLVQENRMGEWVSLICQKPSAEIEEE